MYMVTFFFVAIVTLIFRSMHVTGSITIRLCIFFFGFVSFFCLARDGKANRTVLCYGYGGTFDERWMS